MKSKVLIVAEIGINHQGSVEKAKKLIDVAIDAGCDFVKFQKRTVNEVYSEEELARPRESPFGNTNGDLKYGLEFSWQEYREIDRHCVNNDIEWTASPWDVDSVWFLDGFGVPYIKVASACITDMKLLKAINNTGRPVVISTGMSSEKQIEDALSIFTHDRITILACVSTYPTNIWEVNLARIDTLKNLYPRLKIGFSNHSPGIWSSLCAVAMGAEMLEIHITLDRSSWGSDQAASIEPHGLKKLVSEIRDFEEALGDGSIEMLESERPIMEKLRR